MIRGDSSSNILFALKSHYEVLRLVLSHRNFAGGIITHNKGQELRPGEKTGV